MSDGVRCMWMRGGTSKGGYFLASELPENTADRDVLLLSVMGSPDPRQIDGMGGADPLTSKVAVIAPSQHEGIDVDYLFLQVFVDKAQVSAAQNCGNILAGVGPFAIERGLVDAEDGETPVSIHMVNTGQKAIARVKTPNRRVIYDGTARIDGVPGTAAAIPLEFQDTVGSVCGALFPSGKISDTINGVEATLIDNGMPCVVLRAVDMGISGTESPAELDSNDRLRQKLEAIRRKAGPMMALGDVCSALVPKMAMVSPAGDGGLISTRIFIPHRCHKAIGVLTAVSVATACLTRGAVGNDIAHMPDGNIKRLSVRHPTGELGVIGHVEDGRLMKSEILRTARKLMDGFVFGPPA